MRFIKSLIPTFCFVLIAGNFTFGQQERVSKESLKADLAMNVCENDDRFAAVKTLFKKVGAADDDLKVEQFKNVENLVVTKKGRTAETVVTGAHYDKVKAGCGAIDNWTGIVLLANLYGQIKGIETEKTYLFVAFGSEEKGMVGSSAMTKSIPKEKRGEYCSMINFDSFGFSYPQALPSVSTPAMMKFADDLAHEIKMPFGEPAFEAAADSGPFRAVGIPSITLHGLTSKWPEYLHTSNDKMENVNIDSVVMGYAFAIQFIARIDAGSCGIFSSTKDKK